jgi:hypothetical protein
MPMPIAMVLVRILAAVIAAAAPVALSVGEKPINPVRVMSVHEVRRDEAQKTAVEEAEKQLLYAELQALDGMWTIMMEEAESMTDSQVSPSFFKRISDLRVKAYELAEKLNVELTECHTIRGARREPEQIAWLKRCDILMA